MWTLEVNLNDLYLFVQAVDAGSMSAAARRLDLPKSTVSKRVAEPSARLARGSCIARRAAFRLTPVGAEFFEHARAAVIEAESARDAVLRQAAEPAGVVRITVSVPVAQHILAPCSARALAVAHPKLLLQIHASDRPSTSRRKASTSPCAAISRRCPIPRSCNGRSRHRRSSPWRHRPISRVPAHRTRPPISSSMTAATGPAAVAAATRRETPST